MNQDTLLNLIKAVESNGALKTALMAAKTPEEKAAVAVKNGYQISAQDLRDLSAKASRPSEGELSDDDLGAVTGGGIKQIHDNIKAAAPVFAMADAVRQTADTIKKVAGILF